MKLSMLLSGMRRRVGTNVPDEPPASALRGKATYTYDRGSKLLRNFYIGLSKYTALQPRSYSET